MRIIIEKNKLVLFSEVVLDQMNIIEQKDVSKKTELIINKLKIGKQNFKKKYLNNLTKQQKLLIESEFLIIDGINYEHYLPFFTQNYDYNIKDDLLLPLPSTKIIKKIFEKMIKFNWLDNTIKMNALTQIGSNLLFSEKKMEEFEKNTLSYSKDIYEISALIETINTIFELYAKGNEDFKELFENNNKQIKEMVDALIGQATADYLRKKYAEYDEDNKINNIKFEVDILQNMKNRVRYLLNVTSCFDYYILNELKLLDIIEDEEDNGDDGDDVGNGQEEKMKNESNLNKIKGASFNKNQSNNDENDIISPSPTTSTASTTTTPSGTTPSSPSAKSSTQQPSSTLPIFNLSNDTNKNELFSTIMNEILSTNKSMNIFEQLADLSETSIEEFEFTTSTERLINEYFDSESLNFGKVVNKKGAGKFQNEILKDSFSVTGVKKSQGAIIFEGKFVNSKSSEEFSKIIKEKYDNSRFNGKYNYIITKQEVYPNLDKGIQQAALDSFLGSTPSVIIYPSSWNASVTFNTRFNPIRKFFRSILSSVSVISTLVYAAQATHLFDETITTQSSTDILSPTSDYFLPMVLTVVSIQYFSSVIESVVGSFKNIEVDSLVLPSFTLFNFGLRSTYVTQPMNRSALFDVAVSGILASLISSIIAIFIGFQLTEVDTPAMIAQNPTVPLSLLKTNTIISQLLSSHYGDNVLNIVKNPLSETIGNLGALGVIAGNNAVIIIITIIIFNIIIIFVKFTVIIFD